MAEDSEDMNVCCLPSLASGWVTARGTSDAKGDVKIPLLEELGNKEEFANEDN